MILRFLIWLGMIDVYTYPENLDVSVKIDN